MKRLQPAGILRLSLLAGVTLALLPAQMLARRIGRGSAIPRLFHRATCRLLGVRRTVTGAPPPPGAGGLIVANHVSWLDISVIGAERPLSFVAKSEVAGWPVIGQLAKLQRTVFIDRGRRAHTADVAAEMGARLQAGESVVLFAEGTTGDGTRILPMRSSLLGAAHEALAAGPEGAIAVYPLAITYTGFHGLAGGRFERTLLAWYGDTELAPHLRAVLNAGAIDVELAWGEPISMGPAISRKEATRRAEAMIRQARRRSVAGREPGFEPT
ncbi:MAG: lysophospholipid acyltransferase family protein [Bosea sp. (in: a-proteobacteria)]